MGPVPDVIERARGGDRGAFAELYDTHVEAVYRYVLYRVREPSDAEDLTSDVITRMALHDRPQRGNGSPASHASHRRARQRVWPRARRPDRSRPRRSRRAGRCAAWRGEVPHERTAGGPGPALCREHVEPPGRERPW